MLLSSNDHTKGEDENYPYHIDESGESKIERETRREKKVETLHEWV